MIIIFAVLVGIGVITAACAIILGLHIATCEIVRWWQAHKPPAAGRATPAPGRDPAPRFSAGERPSPPPGPAGALASMIGCHACQPHPDGPCTCTAVCGHPGCVGDHTTLSAFTKADREWLRSIETGDMR